MKKYYLFAKGIIHEILLDRINFFIWRGRMIISLLIAFFLWSAVLHKQSVVSSYTTPLLLTYVLFASLASSIIFSSRSYTIGDDINQGNLSNHLLRPYNYFFVLLASDVGDKAMNTVCSVIELTILFFILKPPIFLQPNVFFLIATFISILVAMVLFFLFGLLLGSIGFWSAEVWGPRFIFGVIITILSGQMFPIDLLPAPLYLFAQLLPFTYLIYFPTKVYLGQLPLEKVAFGVIVSVVWVSILYFLVGFVWKKGLVLYSAQGS